MVIMNTLQSRNKVLNKYYIDPSQVVTKEYLNTGINIVDFNKTPYPKTGTVSMVPLQEGKFEGISYSGKQFVDHNFYMGIPHSVDRKTNEVVFKRIRLDGARLFDMSIPNDRKEFIILIHSSFVVDSPFQMDKPIFQVISPEDIAEKNLEKAQNAMEAIQIVFEMDDDELADISRLMGITPEYNKPKVVKSLVVQKVQDNPDKFYEVYNNQLRRVQEIVHRAIAAHVITKDTNGTYVYGSYGIGRTLQMVYTKLNSSEEADLLYEIDAKSREALGQKQQTGPKVEKEFVKEVDEHVDERMEQEEENPVDEDTELLNLRREAVERGIHAAQFKTDKEEIRQLIAENDATIEVKSEVSMEENAKTE